MTPAPVLLPHCVEDSPVQVESRPGRIRIGVTTLVQNHGLELLDSLLERLVTASSAASVSADRRRAIVTILYDHRRHTLADTLTEIARAIESKAPVTAPEFPLAMRRPDESAGEQVLVATGWRRIANLAAAGGCFALAIVGFITPGIPTIPFVIGTSHFLIRSTPALNERLRQSRLFGALVRDWEDRGGMRASTKVKTIAVMMGLLGTTVLLSGASIGVVAMTTAVGGIDLLVVLCLPTITDDSRPALEDSRTPLLLA